MGMLIFLCDLFFGGGGGGRDLFTMFQQGNAWLVHRLAEAVMGLVFLLGRHHDYQS